MANASLDYKIEGVPKEGGFVIKQTSSKKNKDLLESMKFDDVRNYELSPARLGEEFVFTPKEVDMYGLGVLRAINESADESAHENIDQLIFTAWNQQNIKPAEGGMLPSYKSGGKVKPSSYQEGGRTEFDRVLRNNPEPNDALTPEEIILATLLNNSTSDMVAPEQEKAPVQDWQGMLRNFLSPERVLKFEQGGSLNNDPLGIEERQRRGAEAYIGSVILGDSAGEGEWIDSVKQVMDEEKLKKANDALERIKIQGIFNEGDTSGYYDWEGEVPSSEAGNVKRRHSMQRDIENQRALEMMMMKLGQMGYGKSEQPNLFKPIEVDPRLRIQY